MSLSPVVLGMCLLGEGPPGKLSVGQKWTGMLFSAGPGLCPGHLSFHTSRLLFGACPALLLMEASAGCTQLCWCRRALLAPFPTAQRVLGKSSPWAAKGFIAPLDLF